jgi:hypothetical protein
MVLPVLQASEDIPEHWPTEESISPDQLASERWRSLDALIAPVVAIANDVLQDRRSSYEGAKELWRLSSEMYDLPEALLPFVGLASEWEDYPDHRAKSDQDITVEMERLRRRFGP